MNQNKLIDIFMFREGTEEDDQGINQPVITTGSIIWGLILRTSVLFLASFFAVEYFRSGYIWWFSLFGIWMGGAYPAWRQYNIFNERVKIIKEETLCGSCKYFEESSQLCKILDEHPTKNYIPCEGESWEPIQFDDEY